jgi:hypothetical protein
MRVQVPPTHQINKQQHSFKPYKAHQTSNNIFYFLLSKVDVFALLLPNDKIVDSVHIIFCICPLQYYFKTIRIEW